MMMVDSGQYTYGSATLLAAASAVCVGVISTAVFYIMYPPAQSNVARAPLPGDVDTLAGNVTLSQKHAAVVPTDNLQA